MVDGTGASFRDRSCAALLNEKVDGRHWKETACQSLPVVIGKEWRKMKRRTGYPFAAIVGQEEMKTALLLNIVMPSLGGVLIRGEKGTAKSTTVRAAAALLPELAAVRGCACHCDPVHKDFYCDDCRARQEEGGLPVEKRAMRVIDLPVSATEDRVVGTLDIETAIREGKKKFEPGILAASNRNILYVDEINLLEDHIVDILLDSAAMGINTVEREGISYVHPARFVLVGTMNPEEGDIRPQLLDRFALSVDVTGEREAERRTEVVRRRIAYERDPEAFAASYAGAQEALKARVAEARVRVHSIDVSDEAIGLATKAALAIDVDGHRADITLVKAGIAHAALEGRDTVTSEDLRRVSRLVFSHRLRRRPFEEGAVDWRVVDAIFGAGQ